MTDTFFVFIRDKSHFLAAACVGHHAACIIMVKKCAWLAGAAWQPIRGTRGAATITAASRCPFRLMASVHYLINVSSATEKPIHHVGDPLHLLPDWLVPLTWRGRTPIPGPN